MREMKRERLWNSVFGYLFNKGKEEGRGREGGRFEGERRGCGGGGERYTC